MAEIARSPIARVGVDLSKRVYQVHAVLRLREGFKEERTALINRVRGLLTEFGLVFPQSPEAGGQVQAQANGPRWGIRPLAFEAARLHHPTTTGSQE